MDVISTNTKCPGCGYNLRGLEKQQRCPECGLAFDLDKEWPGFARLPRLSAFDKFCIFFAILTGGLLLIGSGIGAFVSIADTDLGTLLASLLGGLAAWGILRCVRIGLRIDWAIADEYKRRRKPFIPSIYRDPIPDGPAALLDRELDQHLTTLDAPVAFESNDLREVERPDEAK